MRIGGGYPAADDAAQNAQVGVAEYEDAGADATPPSEPTADAGSTSRKDSLHRYAAANGLHAEATQATDPATAATQAHAAAQRLNAAFTEVTELGQSIVDKKQPATDADRAAWQEGQARLRE